MIKLKGLLVDDETRCEHYHSELDIIAIKFKCCETFYPCYLCHNVCEDHEPKRWSLEELDEKAILCGCCRNTLSIREYMNTDSCPNCNKQFNPDAPITIIFILIWKIRKNLHQRFPKSYIRFPLSEKYLLLLPRWDKYWQ